MKFVSPVAKFRSKVNFGNSPGRPAGAVEVEVLRERLRLLVENVERPVEVVHEEPAAARLVAQVVDPRELRARVVVGVVRRDRQRGVVLQLQRQPRRLRLHGEEAGSNHDREESAHSGDALHLFPRFVPDGKFQRPYKLMCPPGPRSPSSPFVCSTFSPPTKKLPLRLQDQWRVGGLKILERLGIEADGRAEHTRQRDPDQYDRSTRCRESLTSHVSSPLSEVPTSRAQKSDRFPDSVASCVTSSAEHGSANLEPGRTVSSG